MHLRCRLVNSPPDKGRRSVPRASERQRNTIHYFIEKRLEDLVYQEIRVVSTCIIKKKKNGWENRSPS